MRIAVIGTGNVGRALGKGWRRAGHEVAYGRRARGGDGERTVADAARWGEAVVLAVPWSATEAVAAAIAPHVSGKPLIDATNPVGRTEGGLSVEPGTSGAEALAVRLPRAQLVKALNQTGAETMADPAFPEGPATILAAGDDAAARKTTLSLARDLGFDAVDAGGLSAARELEALAVLWITLAMRQGLGRGIAFRLMRRDAGASVGLNLSPFSAHTGTPSCKRPLSRPSPRSSPPAPLRQSPS